jgi:hypothetical protein
MMLCIRKLRSLRGKAPYSTNASPYWKLPISVIYLKVITELPMISLFIVCGSASIGLFVLGYVTRAVEQYSRTNTLYNVGIIERHSDDPFRYKIRVDGADYETIFCDDYKPPFEVGEKLQFLTYQDMISCWDIADRRTGFKYYKQNGKAIKFAELMP